MTTPRNLLQILEGVPAWTPHVAGGVNDYDIKVANVEGAFTEHVHTDTMPPLRPHACRPEPALAAAPSLLVAGGA